MLIVGEAQDGLDAVRQAEVLRPDVVTLDIGLPMLNGLEVAARLRVKVPDAKLMFVTNEPFIGGRGASLPYRRSRLCA